MDDLEFRNRLTAALYRAAELDYDIPPDGTITLMPSPSLQRKMRKLMRNPRGYVRQAKRPVYIKALRTAAADF